MFDMINISAVNNTEDEDAGTGVTYFVDEEGRYYYQPAGDNQNLVSLQTASEDNEVSDRSFALL